MKKIILSLLLLVAPIAVFPIQQSANIDLDNLTGTISTVNYSGTANYSNFTGGIADKAISISDATANQSLIFDGTEWINKTTQLALGATAVYFLDDTASGIATYNTLQPTPNSAIAEEIDTITCNAGSGLGVGEAYTDGILGLTSIPAGIWQFTIYGKVNAAVGQSNFVVQIYSRDGAGTETLLFTATSDVVVNTTVTKLVWTSAQSAFTIGSGDRLVLKMFGTSTSVPTRTLSFYHNGTEHYSYFQLPLESVSATIVSPLISNPTIVGGTATGLSSLTASSSILTTANITDITGTTINVIASMSITGDIYTSAVSNYGATSTIAGFSSIATREILVLKLGRLVFVQFFIAGTSNGAGFDFTVPWASQAIVSNETNIQCLTIDNGTTGSAPGRVIVQPNTTTITIYQGNDDPTFTSSGTKAAKGEFFYIAQ